MWIPGFRSRRKRPAPVIVPPVPTPETKMSTLPSVSSQISGPGGAVVDRGIGGIVELARHPGAVAQAGQDLLGPRDGALHSLGPFREDHLAAQRPEQVPALERHRLRHGEDAAIAPRRRDVRQADAGVPRGRLDDEHARAKASLLDRVVDHRGADPVLHRAVRVVALVLDGDPSGQALAEPVEPDQRRVADGLGHVLVDLSVRHGDLGWPAVSHRSLATRQLTTASRSV